MARTIKEKIKNYLFGIIQDRNSDFFSKFLCVLLNLLSFFYNIILQARFFLYEKKIGKVFKSKAKVISAGNITLGGTGKTPLVEAIVEYLMKNKHKAAIISRGYAGFKAGESYLADEPEMLRMNFPQVPVIINKNRITAIQQATSEHDCDSVVLDDAFQNLKIFKNLDIVCIDGTNPFGKGHLLPRGILRLPLNYFKKADIFILTHARLAKENIEAIIKMLKTYNSRAAIFKSNHDPEYVFSFFQPEKRELSHMANKRVAILCGIANPDIFEKTILSLKSQVVLKFYFPDHHRYNLEELRNIFEECRRKNAQILVTTAKDAPRLKDVIKEDILGFEFFVLKVKLKIEDNEEEFYNLIAGIFAA